jgi:hypothetical protein
LPKRSKDNKKFLKKGNRDKEGKRKSDKLDKRSKDRKFLKKGNRDKDGNKKSESRECKLKRTLETANRAQRM